MEERIYHSSRGDVHYWRGGKKGAPVVLFLHGLTADHTMFDNQVAAFEDVYDIVLWDAGGHGASRPYDACTIDACAEDLLGLVDLERLEGSVVVGQSMGGMVALCALEQRPDVFRGFVGIDTTPIDVQRYCTRFERWLLAQCGWMARLYPARKLVESIARAASHTPGGRDNMQKMLSCYTKPELCDLMGQVYRSIARGKHEDVPLTCEVLLLVGDDDSLGSVWEMNEAWVTRNSYTLYVIPDAGHNSNVDNPDAVNLRLRNFFEKVYTV